MMLYSAMPDTASLARRGRVSRSEHNTGKRVNVIRKLTSNRTQQHYNKVMSSGKHAPQTTFFLVLHN